MRVTSDFWVAALLRRVQQAGSFATVVKKGASEAGAIFVSVSDLDGQFDLYAPAPQAWVGEQPASAGRLFECVMEGESEDTLHSRITREQKFDPDIWIIEIEDRQRRAFLDD